METSNEEYKVGVFVSLGLIALATMVFLLGGDKILFHKYYFIHAKFKNVDGLAKGSQVSLAGLNVGNVEKIEFSPDNVSLDVTLRVDMEFQDRITKQSVAKISTKGALGDKFVFISPGITGQNVLQDEEQITTEEHGDFIGTLADNASGIDQIFSVVKEIDRLLKNINDDERSLKLMKNLSISSDHLAQLIKTTETVVQDFQKNLNHDKNLKRSLTHLTNILEKVDQGRGTVGALINDPTLFHRLQELVGSSQKSGYFKTMVRKTIEKNGEMESPK